MPLSNSVSIALRKPAIMYNHGFLRATPPLLSSGVVVGALNTGTIALRKVAIK
jgi:hypothetical protein